LRIFQQEISLKPKKRGFHLITDEIENNLKYLENINIGTAQIFIKHTSCSLSLNENCDSSVRDDMESFFSDIVDDKHYYTHTYEGDDDMPAHIKSSLIGSNLTIPITNGRFNLGTWQGIYLCEHRYSGGSRKVVVTIMGE
jgi:secondary thiamine-phosphate synthase enzyme